MKFGYSIKFNGNLQTTLCAGITLLDSKHSKITRNQKGNQVNIPTVRTKTSGSNSIKSNSVNTSNGVNKLFIMKQLVNQKRNYCNKKLLHKGLCLGLGFLFFLFFIYFLSDCMFVVLLVM